ncbi:hypothetical protein AB1K56_07945 [Microbacterium sp. BWR-S6Y]|uniref:hypothetical protein n=1 Tax=Microbacterium sp. BWR-S6Y TaxID=3232073 RepID=UPI0035270B1B
MTRRLYAVSAIALLLLTGCSAGASEGRESDSAGRASASPEAPLTAETPVEGNDETTFYDAVRSKLRPDNVIPNATDAQLRAAGEKACAAIASGVDTLTLSLIDGEQPDASGFYPDSFVIIASARETICS